MNIGDFHYLSPCERLFAGYLGCGPLIKFANLQICSVCVCFLGFRLM